MVFVAISCEVDDNVEENVSYEVADYGSLIEVEGVTGNRILGSPLNADDLENSEVDFTEFQMMIDINKVFEDIPQDTQGYIIYVQYNGGERIELGQVSELPDQISFDSHHCTGVCRVCPVGPKDMGSGIELVDSYSASERRPLSN